MSKITARSLWVAVTIGLVMMVTIWNAAPAIVRAMGASADTAVHAITYLRCRALASPAALAIYVAIGTFRGFRDTKTPLRASVAANVCNFALDIFLIFGPPRMGVAGAALATSASQYISLVVLVALLISKERLNSADLFQLPPRGELTMFLKVR